MFLFNIVLLQSGLVAGFGVYCNRTMTDLFASPLTGNGTYCSQQLDLLFASALTGTGVYCSQDLTQL